MSAHGKIAQAGEALEYADDWVPSGRSCNLPFLIVACYGLRFKKICRGAIMADRFAYRRKKGPMFTLLVAAIATGPDGLTGALLLGVVTPLAALVLVPQVIIGVVRVHENNTSHSVAITSEVLATAVSIGVGALAIAALYG